MKFPINRSALFGELKGLGYVESTRIDTPNQVLLTENRGIERNTITLKGSGITPMSGLTNQNPSITVKSPTELITYNTTYAKTSAISLDVGLVDDTKLTKFIQASGINPNLFIDVGMYTIDVDTSGNLNIKFTDIFETGLIMLPLIDGNVYQLDQLDILGAATDPVMRFATGRQFAKSLVLSNRKLVPGKTNTYFIPLILKVRAVGEFPNFTVEAVEPDASLATYLAIGPNDIKSSPLTVGWMGVNAITSPQFLPSAASPLAVELAMRKFKVSEMNLTYGSVALVNKLKDVSANGANIIGYANYTNTIIGGSGDVRTMDITYNEDYDKTKTHVLHIYTLPTSEIAALNDTASNGDPIVLTYNSIPMRASEVIARLVEDSGRFYIGFETPVNEIPVSVGFTFNVGGIDNPNTEWTAINWTTGITQTIPKELVIPVVKVSNKVMKPLAEIEGGFKLGIKHMRIEFTVPPRQKFSYGFSDTSLLTIVDESLPNTFDVVAAQTTVAIRDQTLSAGKQIFNKTNAPATLRLYVQVPMDSVNQSVGSNYLVESNITLGAVFDPVRSTMTGNGDYIFLSLQGLKETVDVQGYSHRYQKTIKAKQAVRYKYLSTLAQSISFGIASPLDHTDVTQYQSAVVSAKQTRVLLTSDGNIVRIDEQGFTNIDRIDIREGVFIEAAIDATGKGLVITQLQYPNDDVTKKPFILNISELPNVLTDIGTAISVHVSGIHMAKDVAIHLTDIYDVNVVVPPVQCANNAPEFETNTDGLVGATVSVNDATETPLEPWLELGWGSLVTNVLNISNMDFETASRLRIRKLKGFLTELQIQQANKAYVLYDRFGNIVDPLDAKNITVVNGTRGVAYEGLDVCLANKVCPVFDMTNARSITEHIDIDGKWQVFNDCIEDGEPLTVAELKAKVEADYPDAHVYVLNPIETANAKPKTEAIELSGRWYVEVAGQIFSSEDYTPAELKVALLPFGIDVEIL